MDWIKYAIFALVVFFIVRQLLPVRGIKNISTQTLKGELNKKGIQFVDVRTPSEYKGRHIKEFRNIPLSSLEGKLSALDKDKEVVVICQSGMRSQKAARLLKKNGFAQVTNVKGGMSAWN